MSELQYSETELCESSVSLISFKTSVFKGRTESRQSRERVGKVADGQQVGTLKFSLGVPQHQIANCSLGR